LDEISVILRNNILISIEEFRLLDQYAYSGRVWTLVQKSPIIIKQRTVEYIFDTEALTIFCIVSQNVLATWNTSITKNLAPNEEFHLKDSLFLRPYVGKIH
jgi:hypothetical protein